MSVFEKYINQPEQLGCLSLERIQDQTQQFEVSAEHYSLLVDSINQAEGFAKAITTLSQAYVARGDFTQASLEQYNLALDAIFSVQGVCYPVRSLVPSLEDANPGDTISGKAIELAKKALAYVRELITKAVQRLKELFQKEQALSTKTSEKAQHCVRLLNNIKESTISEAHQARLARRQEKADRHNAASGETVHNWREITFPAVLARRLNVNNEKIKERASYYFSSSSPFGAKPVFHTLDPRKHLRLEQGFFDSAGYEEEINKHHDELAKGAQWVQKACPPYTAEQKNTMVTVEMGTSGLKTMAQLTFDLSKKRLEYMQSLQSALEEYNKRTNAAFDSIKRMVETTDSSDRVKELKLDRYGTISTRELALDRYYWMVNNQIQDDLVFYLKSLAPYANLGATQ